MCIFSVIIENKKTYVPIYVDFNYYLLNFLSVGSKIMMLFDGICGCLRICNGEAGLTGWWAGIISSN